MPASSASSSADRSVRCVSDSFTWPIASAYSAALGTGRPVCASTRRPLVLDVSRRSSASWSAAIAASSVAPVASAMTPRVRTGGFGKARAMKAPSRRPDLIW
jgi:hypothetical protein